MQYKSYQIYKYIYIYITLRNINFFGRCEQELTSVYSFEPSVDVEQFIRISIWFSRIAESGKCLTQCTKIGETRGWVHGHRRLSIFSSKNFQLDKFPILHVRFNLLALNCFFIFHFKTCRCFLSICWWNIRWMLD